VRKAEFRRGDTFHHLGLF